MNLKEAVDRRIDAILDRIQFLRLVSFCLEMEMSVPIALLKKHLYVAGCSYSRLRKEGGGSRRTVP